MKARQLAFIKVIEEGWSEKVQRRLCQVVEFVGELYQLGVVGDDLMEAWLDSKIIKKLTLKCALRLSELIGNKIQTGVSIPLHLGLKLLEMKINDDMKDMHKQILSDFQELGEMISGNEKISILDYLIDSDSDDDSNEKIFCKGCSSSVKK